MIHNRSLASLSCSSLSQRDKAVHKFIYKNSQVFKVSRWESTIHWAELNVPEAYKREIYGTIKVITAINILSLLGQ